jgi:hypothetical protein
MDRSSAKRLSAFIVSVAAGLLFAPVSALLGANTVAQKTAPKFSQGVATRVGSSRALREMNLPRPKPGETRREIHHRPRPGWNPPADRPMKHDPAAQTREGGSTMPGPLVSFEGVGDVDGLQPADTNGAVGPNHFIQWVNISFEIWDKDGNDLTGGPVAGNALWQGFGGDCENINSGDPIILYDQLADRWVFMQPTFDVFGATENRTCWAISKTPDPLGEYWLYEFPWATNGGPFPDYPKAAVWPDAYYVTAREFGADFSMAVTAVDRNAMLNGADATQIYVNLGNNVMDGLLPANLDGTNLPGGGAGANRPAGSPTPTEVLVSTGHPLRDGSPTPRLHFFYFHPDFGTPENSTFTGPLDVEVDDYNPVFEFVDTVPQPPPGGGLEVNGWIQYRAPLRAFGGYESMIVEHDVRSDSGIVGPRWYEVRDPLNIAGGPTINQQGSYLPDDNVHRWMGSAAIDYSGDIAVGFSVTDDTSTNPGIRWAGRLPGDPDGVLGQGEAELIAGDNPFAGFRWGDYSSMAIDPVDQCTFWYTQMYAPASAGQDWSTRIGSFKFPSCSIGPTGTLEGTVTDGTNPIQGVKVTAGAASALTNAAGHYSFTLPVANSPYDMTATKYGYFPGSANGVVVTENGDTVQDFTLAVAPSTTVNGVVRDGSGGGWPLYAKIKITAPGAPQFNLYTDPVTGYYAQTLVLGTTYNVTVTSLVPGYQTGGGTLDLGASPAGSAIVKNWDLLVDALACNAPGYALDVSGYFEDFTSGIPPSWTVDNFSTDGGQPWIGFSGGDPCGEFPGNMTGGSGPYAIVNSNCDGFVTDDTDMITPSVDLSAATTPVVRFNSDYQDCCDSIIDVDYSTNGGANWTNIFEKTGSSDRGPKVISLPIDAAGAADVKARFRFNAFWAWWWQVDNVLVGEASCVAQSGGLVVGNVRDANNNAGINGATVANLGTGDSTKTVATPNDPNNDDGFYVLFSPSGSQNFEASLTNYASDSRSKVVVPNASQRLDFVLQSGHVTAAPTPWSARVDPNGTDDKTITLTNTGGADAHFEIVEINAPLLQTTTHGTYNKSLHDQALARLPQGPKGPIGDAFSTRNIPALPVPQQPHKKLAAGDVIASYPSGITWGWGIAAAGPNIWVTNIGQAGGDDKDYEYADGVQTGNTVDESGAISAWAADGAFNPTTGMFWRVDVVASGSSCIFEVNPNTHEVTGNTICPATGQSERGLAYDPVSNSFWSGSWNDGTIYHFDTSGNILDSAFVNIPISGLAYNANNGHLLVMQNAQGGDDITILDALNNYAVLGSYPILDGGNPAITAFGGAGLEFDCLGNLWAIDQNTQTLYKVDSGETAGCAVDIPWFTPDPTEGTVTSNGGTADINGHFDGAGLLPGLRQAQVQIKSDTPAGTPGVPVTLVVRFNDVADSNIFEAFIYGAAGAGIMMGGPPNCPAGVLDFCPNNPVTRADMAGYIFRAMHGKNTPPPVYQNIFGDVTFNDYNSFYIQGIYDDGITAGCGNGNYCPNDINKRKQMSVFIVKAVEGADFVPPPAQGIFDDVPANDPFAPWIEYLFNQGVTAGCGGNNFCPEANISNGQMAVFLVKAFNVPHL